MREVISNTSPIQYLLPLVRSRPAEILSRRSGIAFADKRGQTHIYPKNVMEIPVPVPPIAQQLQAVARLDTVLRETEEMKRLQEQDSRSLNQLEQAILDRVFRGEL